MRVREMRINGGRALLIIDRTDPEMSQEEVQALAESLRGAADGVILSADDVDLDDGE